MKPHDKILLKNHKEIIVPVSVSLFDLLLFIFNLLANLLACSVQIFMDSGKVLHFRFSILRLFLPILVDHYLELYFKTGSGYSLWPIRHLVWQI